MVETRTAGGSEGQIPLIRLFDGDALMIDNELNVEESRTTEAITLLSHGSAIPRVLTSQEIRDLSFAKRLKIIRGQLDKLSQDEREAALRPIESFSQDQQTKMLKQYDYVRACDKFFARKRRSRKSRNEWCRRPKRATRKWPMWSTATVVR
ncbi:hypothetical protein [Rhodopseudomonas sp.]|uniref:hypothetical protein n=1 Tax=Rhodopseudomonas sp. TaxID=1078 RepID=UPI0039E40761